MAKTGDRPATFGVQVPRGTEAPFIGFVSEPPPVSVVTPTPVPAGGSGRVPVFARLPETSEAKVFEIRVGETDQGRRKLRRPSESISLQRKDQGDDPETCRPG